MNIKTYIIVCGFSLYASGCTPVKEPQSLLKTEQKSTNVLYSFFRSFANPNEKLSIENIFNQMKSTTENARFVSTQLLASSRSLQKDFVKPSHPRVLLTFNRSTTMHSEQIDYWPKLFFGYAEDADQLEAIGFDESKGEFEFFVVDNFSKRSASDIENVSPVSKFECDFCHQNDGPIFAIDPWSETNSMHESLVLIQQGLKQRGHKGYNYLGVPIESDFVLS